MSSMTSSSSKDMDDPFIAISATLTSMPVNDSTSLFATLSKKSLDSSSMLEISSNTMRSLSGSTVLLASRRMFCTTPSMANFRTEARESSDVVTNHLP